MRGHLIFVLGGSGSGKSKFAVELAKKHADEVLFVATCSAKDAEMRQKIKNHKAERPSHWKTLETAEMPFKIASSDRPSPCLLVDCLTLWVSSLMMMDQTREEIQKKCRRFLDQVRSRFKRVIVVSDEVGCSVVPENKLARGFRETLGFVNQKVAEQADQVFFVAAGLPIQLKGKKK